MDIQYSGSDDGQRPTAGFGHEFEALTRFPPFRWQERLFVRFVALDLPTGLGKTSVVAIWLLARAANPCLPRRLIYAVDRTAAFVPPVRSGAHVGGRR